MKRRTRGSALRPENEEIDMIDKAMDRWEAFMRDEQAKERWDVVLGMHYVLDKMLPDMSDVQKKRFHELESMQKNISDHICRSHQLDLE